MPDIELRFHNDMLVLSAPVDVTLARQGVNVSRDRQYLNLMEPDVMTDAFQLEAMAGAQCLVTPTEDITKARLTHVRMENDASRIAHAAVEIVTDLKPQHVFAEIGPCGLPLDPSSKASLNENRAQYADAARAFEGEQLDAFFLNGFTNLDDLRCALMGVYQVTAKPLIASVTIGHTALEAPLKPQRGATSDEDVLASIAPSALHDGYELVGEPAYTGLAPRRAPLAPELWPEAVALMQDMGVSVVGFETADHIPNAVLYAEKAAATTDLPLLAQLRVSADPDKKQSSPLVPLSDIVEYTPDTMSTAAVKLYGAGVQFLRATGNATPSYTGALAAVVHGLDVRKR